MNDSELIDAVRDAAAGEYEVMGEIGRDEGGTIAFLAHELATVSTVALRLAPAGPDATGVPQYTLDVVRELNESVPDLEATCPKCSKPLRKWVRFCTKCGSDVWGAAPSGPGAAEARLALRREAERLAAANAYEFVGEMPRKAGGASAYFARDPRTRRIVALRLTRAPNQNFHLGVTGVVKPLAARGRRPSPGGVSIVKTGSVRPVPMGRGPSGPAAGPPASEGSAEALAPANRTARPNGGTAPTTLTRLPPGIARWIVAALVGLTVLFVAYRVFGGRS